MLETIRQKAPLGVRGGLPPHPSVVPFPQRPAGSRGWEVQLRNCKDHQEPVFRVHLRCAEYLTMAFHHPIISGGKSHCQLCFINKGKALKVMSQPIDCRAHLRLFHTEVIFPYCPMVWRSISVLFPDLPPAGGDRTSRDGPVLSVPLELQQWQCPCRNEDTWSCGFRVAMIVIKYFKKTNQNKNEMACSSFCVLF